ncbi:MAG: hypothetical protein LKJ90_03900 [Faecalibacterium sp.]|jgi:hypothetical protein|nr:hypothetical protein [Faecalibacterium sp.]
MGGGHVTRPDFGLPQADSDAPLTEFYAILMRALGPAPTFMLPGAYVAFRPPYREPVYAENIREFCTFSPQPQPGYAEVLAPAQLRILHMELAIAPNRAPAALMLTAESTRRVMAVQLLPPFLCPGEPLPSVPDSTAALSLSLSDADIAAADESPAALGRGLAGRLAGKQWLHHPAVDTWLLTALAAAQRAYRRG